MIQSLTPLSNGTAKKLLFLRYLLAFPPSIRWSLIHSRYIFLAAASISHSPHLLRSDFSVGTKKMYIRKIMIFLNSSQTGFLCPRVIISCTHLGKSKPSKAITELSHFLPNSLSCLSEICFGFFLWVSFTVLELNSFCSHVELKIDG